MRVFGTMTVVAAAALIFQVGVSASWAEEISEDMDLPAALTAEQIADIDAQIERLNITRAQVIAPEDNPNIDRRPEGVLSVPEVDSGMDQGE